MSSVIETNNTSIGYTTDFVISKDGTKIGYRQFGKGPAIILVHGAMMASQNFMKLASALSDAYTVYVPDRRGRGLSDIHCANYGLKVESEDIQALIKKTNAENIFGLSSGAIISLQTGIIEPSLKKIALYEPPIPADRAIGAKSNWYVDYELAISRGNLGKALINILKGTGDTSLLVALPRFIIVPVINFGIKLQDKKIKEGEIPLKSLIPTFQFDYRVVRESEGILDKCRDIKADILLLGGSKSRRYLKVALNAVNATFPQAKHVEFKGEGHTVADNSGKPELVAQELKLFFASKPLDANSKN